MTIHFLCPNGHHLTAEGHRAGGVGACPHCQVRFLIPFQETVTAESQSTGKLPLLAGARPDGSGFRAEGVAGRSGAAELHHDTRAVQADRTARLAAPGEAHATPGLTIPPGRGTPGWPSVILGLLDGLQSGTLEVTLSDGRVLQIAKVSRRRSNLSIAVARVCLDSGGGQIVAFPWSSVVECRLPESHFDEALPF